MISTELQILIECIKVVLLKKDKQKLIALLYSQSIDWKHINKMVAYHRIRPGVYEALRQVNFTNDFTEELADFSKKQAIKNLVDNQ